MNRHLPAAALALAWSLIPSLLSAEEGWIELFDGKTLKGWTERNKSGSFRVEDGAIVGTAKEGLGTTFLCTDEHFADFELEFECKIIDPGLNSGVQIRSLNRPPKGAQKVGPVEGPQVDISAKNPENGTHSGNIFGQSWGAWLTPKEERRRHSFLKGGEWNHFRVVAQGDQVTTWINGQKVITTTIPAERHATHPSGFIGLQLHGIKEGTGPFEAAWRNLRIRDLSSEEGVDPKPGKGAMKSAPSPAEAENAHQGGSANDSANSIRLRHQGPKTPFRALPEFKDHQLSYFAMAPEINCPVSVVAEPGGAVHVLCDGNAGLGRLPNQGSVWRLVDENDDGKADVATRFIPDIDTPRGGHFLGDTLYLVHPPFVSAFRDPDGDGVADEHQVLASGFAHDLSWKRGGDHTTNDLRVGLDGWIYVAVGDFGASAVGSDGSKATLMTGGVIRMRLDGSDLEVHARGTRNTYDLAISPRLDVLAIDNTNDGDGWDMRLHHLTPLAHMGYPNLYKNFADDAMPPLFTYGGGSGCGALYLEEPGFPDWFNKRFHTISWGKLFTHDLEPHEATFVNQDQVSLTLNKLVDLDVDGSSRLYFANFEGGGARIQPGAIVGHVVQARPKGLKVKTFPDLAAAEIDELIAFLDQGSNVLRQQAQRELWLRKGDGISERLFSAARDESKSLPARIAALFAISLRDESDAAERLRGLLADPALTEFALRALLDREDAESLGLAQTITNLLGHQDPRVRLQAVAGVERLDLQASAEELLHLAKEDTRAPLEKGVPHVHEVIPHTARRALIAMAPVDKLLTALDSPELRSPALAVLRQIHSEENVAGLIQALDRTSRPDEQVELVAVLLRLYHQEKPWDGESWWGTRPNSAGPYYQGASWESSEAIAAALRRTVMGMDEASQKATLFQVRRHNLSLEELNLPIEVDPLEQLLEQPQHTFEQQADLLTIVTDPSKPDVMRTQAFRAALDVTGSTYAEWAVANLTALASIETEEALYESLARDFVQSPSHRITMMQRVPKAYSKIRKLESPQRSLFFDVICTLAQSPLTSVEDRNRVVGGMSGEEVAKAVLTMEGDLEEGKTLFMRQSCVACHSVLPDEPQKGPYLGTVGSLFNREQLITHVIDPAAEVAQGFQTYTFKLKDDSVAMGFVTARNEKTITLRDVAGVSRTLTTSDVAEERVFEGSMMPAGLVNTLTLGQLASLIDYLQSLH